MNKILTLKSIEHFLMVLVVAFAAQVSIGGVPADLSSAAGRSAVVTAIAMGLWRALRETEAPAATASNTPGS